MRWLRRATGVVLIATAALLVFAWQHSSGVTLSVDSPARTYHVDLVGRLDAPSLFLDEHSVRVTARRRGVVAVDAHEIHFADGFDEDFDAEDGPPSWPQENVLRFGRAQRARDGILRVGNASSRALSLLKVSADADLFLFVDLAPGSLTSVATSERAPATGSMHVGADGEWAGGAFIDEGGRDFEVSQVASRCTYDVVVDDARVWITQNSCGR